MNGKVGEIGRGIFGKEEEKDEKTESELERMEKGKREIKG